MGFIGILADFSGFLGIFRDFSGIFRDFSGFLGIVSDFSGFFGVISFSFSTLVGRPDPSGQAKKDHPYVLCE